MGEPGNRTFSQLLGAHIGWWFMALVDALDYIPENHPGRADMIGYIRGLAETLPKYQDKAGLWYQVIDQPKRKGNFLRHL